MTCFLKGPDLNFRDVGLYRFQTLSECIIAELAHLVNNLRILDKWAQNDAIAHSTQMTGESELRMKQMWMQLRP